MNMQHGGRIVFFLGGKNQHETYDSDMSQDLQGYAGIDLDRLSSRVR
jgi:hypothetical protein